MKRTQLIAFFGVDGSGKSTLIKEVRKSLEKNGQKSTVIYMGLGGEFNFPLFKQIMKISSRIKHKKMKNDEKALRKYNFRQRGFLWVLGQYSELWFRYLKAKKLSKKEIIFFDRYFYDGLILGGSFTYKVFRYLTPVPDKSFLISAPAETIRKRKDEADSDDIKKYYQRAEKLLEEFPIIKINNTKQLRKVTEDILNKINDSDGKKTDSNRDIKTQKKLFEFLNKKNINYAVLRGDDVKSMEENKDLDILISKKDYESVKSLVEKNERILHFYIDKEKHFGVTFVPKKALTRRKFDKGKGYFVLSKKDYLRMKSLRKILKSGRNVKKTMGFYKNENK